MVLAKEHVAQIQHALMQNISNQSSGAHYPTNINSTSKGTPSEITGKKKTTAKRGL